MNNVNSDSSFYVLYQIYNTGAVERAKTEKKPRCLQMAILKNLITSNEFVRKVRALVRNLFEKDIDTTYVLQKHSL